ncbi:MAG: hypothetical protein ACRELF_07905 [Gemmataceae bacterium]
MSLRSDVLALSLDDLAARQTADQPAAPVEPWDPGAAVLAHMAQDLTGG